MEMLFETEQRFLVAEFELSALMIDCWIFISMCASLQLHFFRYKDAGHMEYPAFPLGVESS